MAGPSHQITLYHYWRSSCSWRVRWALAHKQIPYTDVPVNLLANEQNSPSYLAINPGGFVPAISYNGNVFGESLAIMEWLEETFAAKPLLPASATDRLRVRQICQMIVSGIQPIQNLSVMRRYSSEPSEQSSWARHWIGLGLEKLEKIVAPHAGTFCHGGQLTMADLCLVPQIYNANRFNVDLTPFPTLTRINHNCLQIAECQAAAPQNQKGATP
jgi:maleylacetoacetate isomerase